MLKYRRRNCSKPQRNVMRSFTCYNKCILSQDIFKKNLHLYEISFSIMSEPRQKKTNKMSVHQTKTLIGLGGTAQTDQSLCCTLSGCLRTQAFFMPTAKTLVRLSWCFIARLIWVLYWLIAALLGFSCRGSIILIRVALLAECTGWNRITMHGFIRRFI